MLNMSFCLFDNIGHSYLTLSVEKNQIIIKKLQ